MGYKTLVSMNIAIAGSGHMSVLLAQKLAKAGHQILIGVNEETETEDSLIAQLETVQNVDFCTMEYAAAIADVIVIATQADKVRGTAYMFDDVRKKVIFDFSVPGDNGADAVNTVSAIKAITGATHVIKCVHTANYKQMLTPLFKQEKADIMMAGESKKAKALMDILAKDMKYKVCKDLGGQDAVALLEEMAKGWQTLYTRQYLTQQTSIKAIKK